MVNQASKLNRISMVYLDISKLRTALTRNLSLILLKHHYFKTKFYHQIPLKNDQEPTSFLQEVKSMLMPTNKILTPQINTSKVTETILRLKLVRLVSPSILVMDYCRTNSSLISLINFKHKE